MIACAAVCVALAALSASADTGAAFLSRAETAIASDAAFLSLHRGFVAYLQAHPETRDAERAWWDVAIEPTMALAQQRFDEALRTDANATAALDAFYDLLARDPELRAKAESLQRIEFTQRDAKSLVGSAFQALRADPDLAARLLGGTQDLGDLSGTLRDFSSYLRERPALGEELNGIFGALNNAPLARTRLVPWWQQLAAPNNAPATAYAVLAQQFIEAPRRFWAWHARELAWASDAQARDWTRYLYRRARRLPGLGDAYVHYLRAAFERSDILDAAEKRFSKEHGPAPAFPPKPAPATLPPLTTTEQSTSPADKKRLVPGSPTRPTRPTMPTLPKIEMRKATPRPAPAGR